MDNATSKLAASLVNNGAATVTVLTGEAPEQHNPQPVTISGTITAPGIILERRWDSFGPFKDHHAAASKTAGKITLHLCETDKTGKHTVIGQLTKGRRFTELGINDDTAKYSPTELANRLKFLRHLFKDAGEHLKITNTLRNLKATVNQAVEASDDQRGTKTSIFKQAVESNVPDEFVITLPLVEGDEPTEITVNVFLEASGGHDINCYLESVEAAELIEQKFEEYIEAECQKLSEKVPVIYY